MRRTSLVRAAAAATVAIAVAGGLAACGGSGGSSDATGTSTAGATPSPSASADHPADVAAVGKIVVTGDAGKEPKVTLPSKPFNVTTTVVRTVSEGTGPVVKKGQLATLHEFIVSGADGSTAQSSYASTPLSITIGESSGLTEFDAALATAHVGSRIVVADAQNGPTYVYVFELTGAKDIPARASGTAVAPKAGLPKVTLDKDGKPSIAKPTGTAPTSLVVQPLIKGKGAVVKNGQTAIVKYTGWLWNGTKFDSSWDKGSTFPFTVGKGQVIPGWDKAVAGQTVGSQILVVVPPSDGYGSTAQGSIPANSTLVFVVDILAAS
ncbi:FKBP-type peptidyl-prolyl cis-trans isomerase [Cellulomonas alba]|uniref:peptidylprolyl isomerase n=1 Tax=Cellulomonas alba TaxID=3053467 RepID=A0ABT7SG51_9CELL|nr:FKBP-type peptidyl-prolyl cis-trans isomerase [Cellulomonas alba]MDM7855150.1 FKBP-type peptidyl-prolyl cis-trans isomerase [Cellulomonas alba]